jgi:hypothetical protein
LHKVHFVEAMQFSTFDFRKPSQNGKREESRLNGLNEMQLAPEYDEIGKVAHGGNQAANAQAVAPANSFLTMEDDR